MKNIAIYGYGKHGQFVRKFINENGQGDYRIKMFVCTNSDLEECQHIPVRNVNNVNFEELDYIIVASKKYQWEMMEKLRSILSENDIKEKVYFEYDFMDMIKHFEPDYQVCTTLDKISYVGVKQDSVILPYMRYTGITYSKEMMDYLIDEIDLKEPGIFLDVGANIGTTSIYIKKKCPNIEIISFEPGDENYKLFNVNCMLNDIYGIKIEKLAISDTSKKMFYSYNEVNPGGSFLSDACDMGNVYAIDCVTIDSYLSNNGIKSEDTKCIWIDVEGMESRVIIGAERTIREKCIPIMMEYNPSIYKDNGTFDEMIEILESNYKTFTDMSGIANGERITKRDISQLRDYSSDNIFTDIFIS